MISACKRVSLLETVKAWAAGLIDGEGCISIYRCPEGPGYKLSVRVGMTHEPTVRRLLEVFGGSVYSYQPKGNRHRAFMWNCCGHLAQSVLWELKPYFVTKARQCELALEFIQLKSTDRRRQGERLLLAIRKEKSLFHEPPLASFPVPAGGELVQPELFETSAEASA